MDYAEGWWLWSRAAYGKQGSVNGRVRPFFYSRADGDGRFLVHGGAEYPGFYALREIAAGANGGAGAGIADGDDAVRVHWRGGNFGVGGAVWRADLGPRGAAWEIQPAAGGVCRVDCADDCHVEYERGGQRGFAFE